MPSPYTGHDDLSAQFLQKFAESVETFLEKRTQMLAAEGNRDKLVEEFVNNSEHPQAVKLRGIIAKAQQGLEDLAEKEVVTTDLPEDEKNKLKAEVSELAERVKKTRSAMIDMANTMSSDPEGVHAAIEAISTPIQSSRGRKPGSTGSSLPRARATLTVNGGNFRDKVFNSFSVAAKALNDSEVKDLQLAFAEAAGVDHANIKDVDYEVTFEFQPHNNGAVYTITATPKASGKPGPKPKNSDNDNDSDGGESGDASEAA